MRDTNLKPIEYKINGKTFHIRKFSIKQLLILVKILSKANKDDRLLNAEVKDESPSSLLTAVFNNLDPDDAMKVLCVFLNTDDKKFVEDNVDLDNLPEIIENVLTLNDVGELPKKVERIAGSISTFLLKK